MANKNISYQTANLADYFAQYRKSWDELYASEKMVMKRIDMSPKTKILDMGCACGGLGLALKERFGASDYTGVDISTGCIDQARKLVPWGRFYAEDFLKVESNLANDYDVAFSLSCADWNVQTEELLQSLFSHIVVGGTLVVSLRLLPELSERKVYEARQRIEYPNSNDRNIEYAPYKVYTYAKILEIFSTLKDVQEIYGYGYWGEVPQSVESLNFERIYYMVFALTKSGPGRAAEPEIILDVADFKLETHI